MDIDKLKMLQRLIPPRLPRGSPENKRRMSASARFQAEAKSQGLTYREAQEICREKRESAGISQST